MLSIFLFIFINLLQTLSLILPVLISVALFTLIERKEMGAMQRRRGPNIAGYFGFLQPFADGLKLAIKESIFPARADIDLFILSPIISFFLSILTWAVIPFSSTFIFLNSNYSILYLYAISALSIYGIIFAGWASNSKYSFLGGLRSTAQMISYEISLGLLIITLIICSESFDLVTIVLKQESIFYCLPLLPTFIIFFISALAETNRAPFDLPEAEAELVSGYNVEYSATGFALFFIAEYSNILLMSTLLSIFFFGGWFSNLLFF
jgi:NADH-quinone oxidoreductase subunit H